MEFLSQRPMFSTDPSTKGFDLSSGSMWIYPENYPLRDYQFEIVKSALYSNTLVCLPTGLGKTFVAAVVMYNFWRWYPQGKIVFLAPTKPLVAQQINACHDIMGIPSDETIELTGATDQKKRQAAWMKHRVIFATPQVFHKDLEKAIVPTDRVKCVVIDEAHKALGKHSYCESIRLLSEQTQYFRVLALSATPGGKLDAVQEVVRNLHITHMELRDDTSPDIIPYINNRKFDIVLVGLGAELDGFKDRYIMIMDRHVRVLVENNVLRGYASNISKGRIFHLQKEWQLKQNKGGNYGQIMKIITILMTMYHAYELMIRHGLRAFYNFYQNHLDKFWLSDERELMRLLEEINYYLGPFPDVRPLPDGSIPEIPEDIRFGHNKFQRLKDLLLKHFESYENKEEETRAIVFVEYRDIVNEVYVLLLQSRPLIRPQKFVGQAGQKQKQQKIALEDFRSNKVNVLISTSVGEEGLDVGEVDLIVCFDISQHSPIRLVQRMGRTGRKRDGHIIVLVTDGKEHQTLKTSMSRRDSLNNKVLQSSGIINALHEESPRMVPEEFNPECQKMVITVVPKIAPAKRKRKATESKKPRKSSETNSKAKNPKIVEPSTSNKSAGSQSSLMKFFKKPTQDEPIEMDEDIVSMKINEIPSSSVFANRITKNIQQSLKNNNTIKFSDVQLLCSDNAALEFLTLCTMKQSENDQIVIDKKKSNPLHPSYYTNAKKYENFFDFEVPDLQILNCLTNITECMEPLIEDENDDVVIYEPSKNCDNFHTSDKKYSLEKSKFEAILDEFSSDTDVNVRQPKETTIDDFPDNEQVDWAANDVRSGFEDVLDDWSNESKTSNGKNNLEDNKANQIPCQAPADILNEPGMFEDILDFSSDEEEMDCSPKDINVQSKAPEETATTSKTANIPINDESKGAFEDILMFSSYESQIDYNSKNVQSKASEKTTRIEKKAEIPINNESKGAFEDILNFSSDESETDCNSKNINILSKAHEETATAIKTKKIPIVDEYKGAIEEILISSSDDSETRHSSHSLKNINSRLKASEEIATRTNYTETTIGNESKGAFEDLLNDFSDDSETDCSLEIVKHETKVMDEIITTTKNSQEIPKYNKRNTFEDVLNDLSNETEIHCDFEIAKHETKVLQDKDKDITNDNKRNMFEDVLNDFSNDTEINCDFEIVKHETKVLDKIITTTTNPEKITNDNKKETLKDNLIFSDDESDTDCSLQLESNVCVPKPISRIKNSTEPLSNNRSRDSSQNSIRISTPLISFEIDESVDLLVDYEMKAISQLPPVVHDQRHFTTITKSSEPSTCGLSRNAAYSVNFPSPASENNTTTINPTKISIDKEKETLKDTSNLSDDESETDCSLELKPDNCVSKKISKFNNSTLFSIENRTRNILKSSNEIFTQRSDVEIDESVDLLADYEIKAMSQLSTAVNKRRNFKTFSKSPESTTSKLTKVLKEKSTKNPIKNKKRIFEDNLNFSDDESETDCSFQLEPDIYISKKNKIKKSPELPIESRSRDLLQGSKGIYTPRLSLEIDEAVNLMENFKPKVSNSSKPYTSELPNNLSEGTSSLLTISQTMREIERLHSSENVYNKSKVNNINKGHEDNKRSSSPIFGDRKRLNLSSCRSGTSVYDTAIESCNRSNKPVDETPESDEDIFATDDFVVDSDFETAIDNIERSVGDKLNTEDKKKSSELTTNNINDKNTGTKIIFEKFNSEEIIAQSSKTSYRNENISNVNSATSSFVSELNIDDLYSVRTRKSTITESVADTVDLADFDWDIEEKNNTTYQQPKKSVVDRFDSSDFDWRIDEAKNSTIKPAKESLADTVDLNDCDWENEVIKYSTPPAIKNPLTDVILDDCDWASDFEVYSSPSKASTSFCKNFEKRESTGISNLLKIVNNNGTKLSKDSDSGWISPKNPKLSLSLGKKLTKNLISLRKKSCQKPRETTQDSDSENDFAVGRLEKTLTKQIESDFFVKPDPVDKLTTDKSLGMSNSRRIIRGPLTLRRNDINKLSINGLTTFAAPNKYTQQHETRKNIIGAGRQKSASLNFDTRKRKKKQDGGRNRGRVRSEFIDDEAEVSTDNNDSSGSSGTDGELQDFVSYTQHHDEAVDMQAHYLQTIRSPHRAGGFLMRKPKSPDPNIEIYSQALPDEPNSYLYDSFCVAEDDDVFEDSEPSEITLLEKREMRRKSRKRKRVQSEGKPTSRKRRVIAPSRDTSSSEDDFEKLRQQIREESS